MPQKKIKTSKNHTILIVSIVLIVIIVIIAITLGIVLSKSKNTPLPPSPTSDIYPPSPSSPTSKVTSGPYPLPNDQKELPKTGWIDAGPQQP